VHALQVVADDLLLLREGVAADGLEPICEPCVEFRALRLRDRGVRRIAGREMTEPLRVLAWQARVVRAHELLANQRHEVSCHLAPDALVDHLPDGADEELRANDGGRFDRCTLVGIEPVEPRREQRVDRGWEHDGSRLRELDPAVAVALQNPSSISISSVCSTNSGFPSLSGYDACLLLDAANELAPFDAE
jgi:hypothetical protein